jgi:hypothetical protein
MTVPSVAISSLAGGTSPGAIENQQLLLDEYGLGHHGTRPAWTGEPGNGRQEVENQDGQVAHGTMLKQASEIDRNAKELGIRHAQDHEEPCWRRTEFTDKAPPPQAAVTPAMKGMEAANRFATADPLIAPPAANTQCSLFFE